MGEIERTEFPSNSHRLKTVEEDPPEQKRVEKVIKGKLIKRKKSFLNNFSQTFFGDDAKSVMNYVIWDVLIPAAKETISDMVSTGVSMLLFGEGSVRGSTPIHRDKNVSRVSYNSFFNRNSSRSRISHEGPRNRSRHNFDDLVIASRGEAEEVLSTLVDLIDEYDVASVADLYDALGITTDYSDNKWGWDNLNRAVVRRVRDGYILDLPKPFVIE